MGANPTTVILATFPWNLAAQSQIQNLGRESLCCAAKKRHASRREQTQQWKRNPGNKQVIQSFLCNHPQLEW